MAKKKPSPFTADEYGFGNEFDFPEFDFEEPPIKTKREAVERIAGGAKEGLLSSLKSPSFFRELVKSALPKGYGQALDLADTSASTLRNLYNDGVREVKPALQDLARTTDKLMPSAEKYLPKSASEALKKFSEKHRIQTPTGLSAESANEIALRMMLADVFKATAQSDISREARSNVKEHLTQTLHQERHRDQLSQLDGIRTSVSQMAAYQRKIEFGFHKKSLELQARSYFVQVASLEEQKRQNVYARQHLAGILSNTALPDYVKMTHSEQFMNLTRNKFMNSFTEGMFSKRMKLIQDMGNAVRDQTIGSLKAGVEGVRSGLSGAEMAADAGDSFGTDKWRSGGRAVGGGIAKGVGALLGRAMNGRVNGSGNVMRRIRSVGNRIQSGIDQLPAHANEAAESTKSAREMVEDALENSNLSPEWKSRLANLAGKVGDPLLDFGRNTIKRANSYDKTLLQGNVSGLTEPAVFNNQVSRSITEIIPGYLARIHQEIRVLRTGDASTDMVEFNYDKGMFDTAKGVRTSVHARLSSQYREASKDDAGSFSKETEALFDEIDPEKKLTKIQRRMLSSKFLKDNMNNKVGTLDRYSDEANFAGSQLEKHHAKKLAEFFKNKRDADGEGALQVKFGEHFTRIGSGMNDSRAVIQNYLTTHHGDALRDMGLIKEGSDQIDMDALHAYTAGKKYVPGARLAGGSNNPLVLPGGGPPALPPPSLPPSPPILPPNPLSNAGGNRLQGYDDSKVVEQLKLLHETLKTQDYKPLIEVISETLTNIHTRLENGILTQPGGNPGPGGPGGPPGRRGLLRRIAGFGSTTIGDAARGIYSAGKWGVKKAASLGNSLVGGGFNALTTLATGGLNLVARAGISVGAGAYRRTMGFLDVYVGNETTPRLYARKVQEGAYFDTVTRRPIKRFSDITDNGVSDVNGVLITPEEVPMAYVKAGPVKKTLKAMGAVLKAGAKVTRGIGVAVLAGIPLVYGAALWGAKKAWGLLYTAADVFVKDKLDSPVLTARTMRAGGYRSRINGHVIKHPGQIDGPVIDDQDETLLTNEDIAKGLVNKHNKPLKTGVMKLLGMATGLVDRAFGLGKKAGNAVWKLAKASLKNTARLLKGAGKIGIHTGGFLLDRLRGRPMGSGGGGAGASDETAQALIQTGMDTKDVMVAIYDLLADRLAPRRKRVGGDVDGDGTREGSYADLLAKRKAAKAEAARLKAANAPVVSGLPPPGANTDQEEEEDDDDDGMDVDIDLDDDGRNRREGSRRGNSRSARRARRMARLGNRGFWGRTKQFGRGAGRLLGSAGGRIAAMAAGGLSLGGLASGAGAVASGLGAAAGAVGAGLAAVGSAIVGVVGAPVLIAAAAITLVVVGGYLAYKYLTKKRLGIVSTVRYVQYGFEAGDKDHLQSVFGLEDKLKDALVFGKDGATLDPSKVDTKKLMDAFDVDVKDEGQVSRWLTWFGQRFKPVYLTHVTALKGVAPDKGLDDVDKLDVALQRKYFNATKFLEGPYGVYTSPFNDLKSLRMGSADVKSIVDTTEVELVKKEKEVASKAGKVTTATVGGGLAAAVTVAELNAPQPQGAAANASLKPTLISSADLNAIAGKGSSGLNTSKSVMTASGSAGLASAAAVGRLDAIAAIRMKAYGLTTMVADKVKTLLTLEKQVSASLQWTDKIASWSGDPETALQTYGAAFGASTADGARATEWLTWFNQRFLPVLLNYATAIKAQTDKEDIYIGRDSLKPAQLVEVATSIAVASAEGTSVNSIWAVTASPWPDYLVNTDVKSIEGNIQALRELSKNAILTQEGSRPSDQNANGGLAERKAPTSTDKTQQDKAAESSGWFSSLKSKVGGWFGSSSKDTPTTTTGLGGGDPSAGTGGTVIAHPGKGSGGDVNSLPMPKGNGTYASMKDLIHSAANMVGVDPRLMSVMAAIESSFDATAKAGKSSATGLYQFVEGTWGDMLRKNGAKYGIAPNASRNDPRANALMGAEYIKENANYLTKKLKRPLTDTDLYIAHFMGGEGAREFLSTNPDTVGATAFRKAAASNPEIFFGANKSPRTVGEIYSLLSGRVKNKGKSFGIGDGGENLIAAKPSGTPALSGPTKPAASAVAGAVTPVAKVATQNGIGSKAPVVTVAASASPTAVAAVSKPVAANDTAAVNMAGIYGGFTAPQASSRDLAAQAKYQNEVKVLALDTTNKTLAQSLDIQKQSLVALNSIAAQMEGLAKGSNTPPESKGVAQPTPAGRAPRDGRPMAQSPISLAKPAG